MTTWRILVVIPALNEALNIPNVIRSIRVQFPQWDVLVVDDGSTDDTAGVARSCGATVIRLPFNLGIGGAVQTGLLWGARKSYDVVVQLDGDGQHDIGQTAELVRELHERQVDAVLGSRFLSQEGFRSSRMRRIGISILRLFLSVLTKQKITDPTSGQRAFGRRAIELLSRCYPQQYPEPEVVYLLARSSLRFAEVSVVMKDRQSGRSSIGSVDSLLYMIKVMLALLVDMMAPLRRERLS